MMHDDTDDVEREEALAVMRGLLVGLALAAVFWLLLIGAGLLVGLLVWWVTS